MKTQITVWAAFLLLFCLPAAVQAQQAEKEMIENAFALYNNQPGNCTGCPGTTANDQLSTTLSGLVNYFNGKNSYPGFAQVGKEASAHYFAMLGSGRIADAAITRSLELMYTEVLRQNADPEAYASFYDKLSYKQKGKQVYGTIINVDCITCGSDKRVFTVVSLADEANVDKMRKKIGLDKTLAQSLAAYKETFEKMYGFSKKDCR
jgi:hypothetical protein